MIVALLYAIVALLTVYPLRRALRRTGTAGGEATLAALVLSTMWAAIALYGTIAWCVSADVRSKCPPPRWSFRPPSDTQKHSTERITHHANQYGQRTHR